VTFDTNAVMRDTLRRPLSGCLATIHRVTLHRVTIHRVTLYRVTP
jgi:hypothetical protein